MSSVSLVAAVDLGASGGRVMVGEISPGQLALHEAHRFDNRPVMVAGTVYWDVLGLYAQVLDGLRAAGTAGDIASIGIDSWGVDYGLLDDTGALLGNPVHYRDGRTTGVAARVLAELGAAELYAVTGIAELPINTLFQLVSAIGSPQLEAARNFLMIPDLLGYWLTGRAGAEVTNASTTQLLDVTTGNWATPVMSRAGLPPGIFPALRRPGEEIGSLLPEALDAAGLSARTKVVAVASHDTASAVVAVPAAGSGFCYISCGTWSLVGVELDRPVLTEESRLAQFTNETGIDGTVRYLRNVMGLWLLQESIRTWASAGVVVDLEMLLVQAARVSPLRAVVDPDDLVFLPPGDMPGRIADYCARSGQPVPADRAETVRCVLDSLALAHRRAVDQVQRLSGRAVDVVHLVGGGSRNALLCQLTADACGLPVLAGPVEATALGNALVQARALGAAPGDLAGLRELVRTTQPVRRFEPSGSVDPWRAAAGRLSPYAG
ncbi:MAG TPA: rhamnulokinase family protein [Streptosporangiaceae bacterium]|nr:rhamnulokinase family protein [Streptosporangiaceae bacterium]